MSSPKPNESLASRETVAPASSSDSTPSGPFASLPAEFGRFRILKLLGRGAMGTVYLAFDPERKQEVALKIPRFVGEEDPILLERFRREARAASGLDHPNICGVYEVGQIGALHFISMQYVDGRPLSDYISPEQPQRGVVAIIRKLSLALAHAHSRGVVHRDLKPANIMVDGKGEPIIMDFGLARQIDAATDVRATQSGMLVGSPAYMAPEQARAEHDRIGAHTDIYGLGVLFFEMLTGQLPFQGPIVVVLGQVVNDPPPKPSDVRSGIDSRLESLCLQMLHKHPESRPASMDEVARVLTEWIKARSQPAAEARVSSPSASDVPTLAPVKPATPRVEKTDPVTVQKERVRELLADYDYAAAIELLERFIKTKDARFEKLAVWAKGELPKVRDKERELKEASAPLCATARQLLEHHDYADAVKLLEEVPPHFRSIELRDLLQECTDRRDECDHLERDIADAIRQNDEILLPTLVKQLLKLKPANKALKKLHADLKKYGTAKVIVQRKGQRRFVEINQEQTFETKHIVAFIVGFVALCVGVYVSTVMYIGTKSETAAINNLPKLNNVPNLNAAVANMADAKPGDKIPADAVAFNGHSYKYFAERLSWTAAKRKCEELGGHLPIVENREENDFLLQTARTGNKTVDKTHDIAIWLGATDSKAEKQWRWLNDEGMSFSNWHRTQPNNKNNNEHYATLVVVPFEGVTPGDWCDQPEDSADQIVHFICEWDRVRGNGSDTQEWVPLFTGTNLKGWSGDTMVWSIDKGVLRVNAEYITQYESLVSDQKFGDFELKFQYRMLNEGLTGVWLRGSQDPAVPDVLFQLGYFTHRDKNRTSTTGDLFTTRNKKSVHLSMPSQAQRRIFERNDKSGDWVNVYVRCEGPRIIAEVNDVRAVDFTDPKSEFSREGPLVFHAPPYSKPKAEFREIRVRKLTSTTSQTESLKSTPQTSSAVKPSVSVPAATSNSSSGSKADLDADFRKSDGGFFTFDDENFRTRHVGGEYHYAAKKPGWWIANISGGLNQTYDRPPRDFEIEIDVRFVDQTPGEFALSFGKSSDKKFDLCLNRNGNIKLTNNVLGDLVPPARYPGLKSMTTFNTLRLNVRDRLAQVSLNGSKIFESHLPRYAPGAIQFWLGPEKAPLEICLQRVRFERLPATPVPEVQLSSRRLAGHKEIIREVACLSDNLRAVSVGNGGAFKMWNIQTGELLHDFQGHTKNVTSVSVSDDGKRALTGCDDNHVRLWDLENKKLLKTLRSHTAPIRSVRISRDGLVGLSASMDTMIRRWDLKEGKSTLVSNAAPDATLAVSPDGSVIATGHPNGQVVLRSVQGEVLVTGHGPARIECITFSPDATHLATCGADATVCIFDLQTGKHLLRLEGDDLPFGSAVFNLSGEHVIAGNMDGTMRTWELKTGKLVALQRAGSPVTHRLAITPDNDYIVTGGGDVNGKPMGDYDLRVWKVPKRESQ